MLCCVASGLANREIAQVLKITDGTVKVHVKHLLKKLKFHSRVEAAVWASEHDFRLSTDQLTQYGFDRPSSNPEFDDEKFRASFFTYKAVDL